MLIFAPLEQANMKHSIRPPIIVLKPFPLVVPYEVAESLVAAVAGLDQSRSPEERRARQQRPAAQRLGERRVEIEAVLQELTVESRAPKARP